MAKQTISDREMQEIFKNWNTPFGKIVRELNNWLNENWGLPNEYGFREFVTAYPINLYLDGEYTEKECFGILVNLLSNRDMVYTDSKGSLKVNSDDNKFKTLFNRAKKYINTL